MEISVIYIHSRQSDGQKSMQLGADTGLYCRWGNCCIASISIMSLKKGSVIKIREILTQEKSSTVAKPSGRPRSSAR